MSIVAVKDSRDRYVIVDEDTGEILDDAQGYGFKTAEKAYKCYHYKHRSQEQKDKESEVKNWIKNHKEFISDLEDIEFYLLKDGDKLNSKVIADLLKENNLDVNFTPKELLTVLKRKR